ncbi:YdaS family helix-turn-helix protein [Candidatus Fukatsuia symbiotica]|uniref:Cro/Cl family transcriptional regulator n=1 Tax=Candidatus Fukatsuia symbiotica TaxID=1878942 RepID=A0A2U8I4U5_9GAMM|nr:YdaS family helix-turn-helix protein [Candidatus Fukatsuia symbiotica]AWK14167.1 Cro/Cl family transcriptional regulator [Candidatus Fukatsuia symbiotica]MEA9446267.1 YdaS family helix-turn-helix protein [Candidatus Fukatsuia symbiotica]
MNHQIKKRIAGIASQTEIASCLGYEPQTISLWLKNGVPPKKIICLCKVLAWQVTPHELNPNVYPNPTDGLPLDKHQVE